MMRLPFPALLMIAAPAGAADRGYAISGFDRIRVDGPFRVELTLGRAPGARIDRSADADIDDRIDLRVEGDTLTIRAGTGVWGERAAAEPKRVLSPFPTIRVSVPTVRFATMIGGGDLAISGPLRGQRVDLALTGSGTLTATAIAAEQVNATVIGSGTLTLKGKAARARLNSNGTTRMLAGELDAGDLTVTSNGAGETVARARYTASVFAAGVGAVTIYGKPACRVNKNVQGPVSCGLLPPP